jgi:putative flippase GtrA
MLGQFLTFAVGGTLAFMIDSIVLLLMIHYAGAGLYSGRLVSYLVAASFSWAFHRTVTFRTSVRSRKSSQWLTFLFTNAFGGMLNLGVYAVLVADSSWIAQRPLVALALGSISGLALNFFASRIFVFRLTN